mmetsp:Transcript_38949/g.80872  ORF Transcript_38949/g.80872 Transcript_38949/m.80872 type:complete len:362 (-) Transcript_38949:5240-6325(-)
MSNESVVSRESRGSNPLRDDRSTNDTVSVASSDDFLLDATGTFIRSDKFHKQKRRGSGLGNLANYFKANIKKVIAKDHHHEDSVPAQVNMEGKAEEHHQNHAEQLKAKATSPSERSPRDFLDVMWRSRGYSRELFATLETAYHNEPSPLQVASHHSRILEMVRKNEISEISDLMKLGISPNPATLTGQSLVHEVCRLGNNELLTVLMSEFGADVQISDSNGRTPLHEACLGGSNEPHFAVVDILATKDTRMFSLKDVNGRTPLDCIPIEQWGSWIDFLYVRRDMYWPRRLVRVDGMEQPPPLALEKPNSRPVTDPTSALTIDFASLLVSGDITAEAVAVQKKTVDDAEATSTDDSTSTTTS